MHDPRVVYERADLETGLIPWRWVESSPSPWSWSEAESRPEL